MHTGKPSWCATSTERLRSKASSPTQETPHPRHSETPGATTRDPHRRGKKKKEYWVGRKVRSGFPVTSYENTRRKLLASPIHMYNGILFCPLKKKEGNPAICNNMDGPREPSKVSQMRKHKPCMISLTCGI